jgi:hypothetical protein
MGLWLRQLSGLRVARRRLAALARFWFAREWRMKLFVVLACGLGLLSGSVRAAEPILLQARTAGELAALCGAEPGSPGADARINYCHGFAQGAVDTRLHGAGDRKPFCFPVPPPTRTATMRDFVKWVHTSSGNGQMPVLDGLFKFLGERYPCK